MYKLFSAKNKIPTTIHQCLFFRSGIYYQLRIYRGTFKKLKYSLTSARIGTPNWRDQLTTYLRPCPWNLSQAKAKSKGLWKDARYGQRLVVNWPQEFRILYKMWSNIFLNSHELWYTNQKVRNYGNNAICFCVIPVSYLRSFVVKNVGLH